MATGIMLPTMRTTICSFILAAISLAGLSVILNEQIQSASGIVVNALRVTTPDGLINVVVGSANAGI